MRSTKLHFRGLRDERLGRRELEPVFEKLPCILPEPEEELPGREDICTDAGLAERHERSPEML